MEADEPEHAVEGVQSESTSLTFAQPSLSTPGGLLQIEIAAAQPRPTSRFLLFSLLPHTRRHSTFPNFSKMKFTLAAALLSMTAAVSAQNMTGTNSTMGGAGNGTMDPTAYATGLLGALQANK